MCKNNFFTKFQILFISHIFTNFEISFHEISLNARHSYNEHVEQETLLIQLWAVSVIARGRFGHRCGPFWTCQKFVGRFGVGRFGFGPFWYRPSIVVC